MPNEESKTDDTTTSLVLQPDMESVYNEFNRIMMGDIREDDDLIKFGKLTTQVGDKHNCQPLMGIIAEAVIDFERHRYQEGGDDNDNDNDTDNGDSENNDSGEGSTANHLKGIKEKDTVV